MVPRRDVPPPAVSMLSPRDDLTQRITAKLRGKITELYGFTAGKRAPLLVTSLTTCLSLHRISSHGMYLQAL